MLEDQGKYDEAITYYDRSLEINPENVDARETREDARSKIEFR